MAGSHPADPGSSPGLGTPFCPLCAFCAFCTFRALCALCPLCPLCPSLLAANRQFASPSPIARLPLYATHKRAHKYIHIHTHMRTLLLTRHLIVRSFCLSRLSPVLTCTCSQGLLTPIRPTIRSPLLHGLAAAAVAARCAKQRCGYGETSPRRYMAHSFCHRPICRFPILGWFGCEQTEALGTGWLPQSVRARRTKASLGAGIREEETLAAAGRVDRGRNGKRGVGSVRVVDCRR